jgi:probable HAF family extracellular repeat protein
VNGQYTAIAYPGAQLTYAQAINDNGAVVGAASVGLLSYGFLWQNGTFTDINYPKAPYGTGLVGVNNSGVIVGNHFSADRTFGFLYENGVFKNIVYTGANFSVTGGINNNGLISGQVYFKGGDTLGYTAVCK